MYDLRFAIEKTCFPIHEIISAFYQAFFYPADALEPGQFQHAGIIFEMPHDPFAPASTDDTIIGQPAFYLYKICLRSNLPDLADFCFVYMAMREMIEQI